MLTALINRVADRRCPDCGARQPLYVGGFQRGGADVVACPGCGLPLRLAASHADPNDVLAGLLFTLLLTGAILAVVWGAAAGGFGETVVLVAILAVLIPGAALGILWGALSARGRDVLRVTGHDMESDE